MEDIERRREEFDRVVMELINTKKSCICHQVMRERLNERNLAASYSCADNKLLLSISYDAPYNQWLLNAKFKSDFTDIEQESSMVISRVINNCPFCGRRLIEQRKLEE